MTGSDRAEIANLEALYSANPEGRIFTHLADAYRRAGELSRAREVLERGLISHSDYASAYVVLGRVLHAQGELEQAEEAFNRVLSLDPENRVALRSLADMAREEGLTTVAIGYYQELLVLNPNDGETRALLEEVKVEASEQAMAGAGSTGAEGGDLDEDLLLEDEVVELDPEFLIGEDLPVDVGSVEGDLPEIGEVTMVDEAERDEVFLPEVDEGYDLGLVVTETMGDLYASQGLVERAAEVYRELLLANPGDERLQAKLARLDESDLDESDLGGVGYEVEPLESMSLEGDLVEEVGSAPVLSGRTIGEYLRGLVSYEPGGEEGADDQEVFRTWLQNLKG